MIAAVVIWPAMITAAALAYGRDTVTCTRASASAPRTCTMASFRLFSRAEATFPLVGEIRAERVERDEHDDHHLVVGGWRAPLAANGEELAEALRTCATDIAAEECGGAVSNASFSVGLIGGVGLLTSLLLLALGGPRELLVDRRDGGVQLRYRLLGITAFRRTWREDQITGVSVADESGDGAKSFGVRLALGSTSAGLAAHRDKAAAEETAQRVREHLAWLRREG